MNIDNFRAASTIPMQFEERGQIEVKVKGAVSMYFVNKLQNSEIITRISDLLTLGNEIYQMTKLCRIWDFVL